MVRLLFFGDFGVGCSLCAVCSLPLILGAVDLVPLILFAVDLGGFGNDKKMIEKCDY